MRNPDKPKFCPAITPPLEEATYTHEEQKWNGNQSRILASAACTPLSGVLGKLYMVLVWGQSRAFAIVSQTKSQNCLPLMYSWRKKVKEKRKKKLARFEKRKSKKEEREEEDAEGGGGSERRKVGNWAHLVVLDPVWICSSHRGRRK